MIACADSTHLQRMRHIWICIIDGCLVRSGMVQPGDTMPMLMERLTRIFPHMGTDSIKVVCEDGRVFDTELPFSSPSLGDAARPEGDDALAAVGVVEGHVGVKVHHGKPAEDILNAEANTFSGRLTDNMDFGLYDFSGEQIASIEDIITLIGPENAPDVAAFSQPQSQADGPTTQRRRARRQPRFRRGGRGRQPKNGNGPPQAGQPAAGSETSPGANQPAPESTPPPPSLPPPET